MHVHRVESTADWPVTALYEKGGLEERNGRIPLSALRAVVRPGSGSQTRDSRASRRRRARRDRIPVLGRELLIRLGTTDVHVAAKVLLDREYELPLDDVEVVIDAGAYTGISSLWFAASYPAATVVALEPDGANFEVLCRNVAGIERIIPLHEALWSHEGMVSVHEDASGAWGNRVGEADERASVAATTVGTLMRRLGIDHVDLLKLDIEGAEVEVFENAHTWLGAVEAVAVETHDRFRDGSRAAVIDACSGFTATDVGHETLLLTRGR